MGHQIGSFQGDGDQPLVPYVTVGLFSLLAAQTPTIHGPCLAFKCIQSMIHDASELQNFSEPCAIYHGSFPHGGIVFSCFFNPFHMVHLRRNCC